jgi:hypothetical protein
MASRSLPGASATTPCPREHLCCECHRRWRPTGTAAGATATRPHPPTSLPDAATSKLGATALVNFATAVIRVHAAAASPDRVTAVGKQVRA